MTHVAMFIMISNSISSESRGSLNGSGQTLGSIGRFGGPIWAGILFSWSLENGIHTFPLDFHFVFILLVVLVLATYFISLLVRPSIDQRVAEIGEEISEDFGENVL